MVQNCDSYSEVVQALCNYLNRNTVKSNFFQSCLEASLSVAKSNASTNLNPDLYNALDNLYENNGWPTNAQNYLDFLTLYEQKLPNEGGNSNPAWTNTDGGSGGYSQEISDRLCHFYWLIDQNIPNTDFGNLQNFPADNDYPNNPFSFADWLVKYANEWGSFLDTQDSITPEKWASFQADKKYNTQDSSDKQDLPGQNPPWRSFNSFFYRKLNDGLRPISNPGNNQIVCSPADCTYRQVYSIGPDGTIPEIILKGTHTYGSIDQLLDNSRYAENFRGGTFVHYFLDPFDYHRFHVPVNGNVVESRAVNGQAYLALNINLDPKNGPINQFLMPDSSTDGYEFTQARGIIIIDTSDTDDIGLVATLPVGMTQVSSVKMEININAGDPPQSVSKGDEFGYFAFGGSDIIMLFEKPVAELTFLNQDANPPYHFKYGEASVKVNP